MKYVEIKSGFPQCTDNGTQEVRKGCVKDKDQTNWKPRWIIKVEGDSAWALSDRDHDYDPHILTGDSLFWKYYTFDDPYAEPPKPGVSEHDEMIGFVTNLGPGWAVKMLENQADPVGYRGYTSKAESYSFAKFSPEGVRLTEWKAMSEWKEEWKNETR